MVFNDTEDYDWGELQSIRLPALRFSPMARARLKIIHDNGVQLKAHKVRHANQDEYKQLITDSKDGPLKDLWKAYVLTDYWAKLPARSAHTACCESHGKGISVLGTMLSSIEIQLCQRGKK